MKAWPVLLMVVLSRPALAQFRLPSLIGVWDPVAGSGAVYSVMGSDGSRSTLELDCLGAEGGGQWLELVKQQNGSQTVVKQLLGEHGLLRVILKANGKPAVEVPPAAVVGGGAPLDVQAHGRAEGHEKLTLNHQTYATERFEVTDASRTQWDVWISREVPPCDLVELRSTTLTIALRRRLQHVQTHITEKPRPLVLP